MQAPTNKLAHFLRRELELARTLGETGENSGAWHHLERAHVLSQPSGVAHALVHCAGSHDL